MSIFFFINIMYFEICLESKYNGLRSRQMYAIISIFKHNLLYNCFFASTFQIVYPVYTKMIEHLCSKALGDFNTELIRSLNSGERFDSSVRTWTRCIMVEFEKVFAGNNQIGFLFMLAYTFSFKIYIRCHLVIPKSN